MRSGPAGRDPWREGDGAATDGAGVGDGDGDAESEADGAPPGPAGAGGPSNWVPTTRATATAAAARPMGTSLFMSGNLHGPRQPRGRVAPVRSRTASNGG